jgi:hypothetical protein
MSADRNKSLKYFGQTFKGYKNNSKIKRE